MRLIVNRILFEYFILTACVSRVTLGQYPRSPCPNIFSYLPDENGWYGLITRSSYGNEDEIKTVIYMTYDGISKKPDVGDLKRVTSNEELAHGGPIRYRVDLNVFPPPRLTKIEFNGGIVCQSNHEDGVDGTTTVRREHTLYLKGDTMKSAGVQQSWSAYSSAGHQINSMVRPTTPPVNNADEWRSKPSAFFAKASSIDCGVQESITNGGRVQEQTLPGQWPWLVALYHTTAKRPALQCGASLLGNRFIVTAAHCVYNSTGKDPVDTKNVAIVVGITDVSVEVPKKDLRRVSVIFMHEEYDPATNANDIALLVLENPVVTSKLVKPVCQWEDQDEPPKYPGTMVGWGETEKGPSLKNPLRIDVAVVPLSKCQGSFLQNVPTDKIFCGVNTDNAGLCSGFGGSGFYVKQIDRWALGGVVSTYVKNNVGSITCSPTSHVIYTDVSKYREWIKDARCQWAQM